MFNTKTLFLNLADNSSERLCNFYCPRCSYDLSKLKKIQEPSKFFVSMLQNSMCQNYS